MLYTPDRGWMYPNTALMPTRSHGRFVPLRAIAWPRPNVLIGVGSAGALVTSLRDPVPFDLTPEGSPTTRAARSSPYDDLPVEATLLAVACTATDPLECTAVGRNGLIVRGDGSAGTSSTCPPTAPAATDLTSVAYDGRTPLAATTDGLYGATTTATGRATTPCAPRWRPPAGRPRWSASRPSRAAAPSSTGASSATRRRRRGGRRARRWTSTRSRSPPSATAARSARSSPPPPSAPPLPEPVEPDDGDRDPPNEPDDGPRHEPVPLDASPVDAVVLRETADGWVDLDGASYQPSGGRDLPRTTPNTRAFVLDPDGTGLALGGIAGIADRPARPDPFAATASARRLEHGGPAPAARAGLEPAETGDAARRRRPPRDRRAPGVPGSLHGRQRAGPDARRPSRRRRSRA